MYLKDVFAATLIRSVHACEQLKQAVREAATTCSRLARDLDHLTLKVSESRVTCANFSLPRPLCSRLRPDVRDGRQTDIRQHHRLMPLGGANNSESVNE